MSSEESMLFASSSPHRFLAGGGGDDDGEHFGVHIAYTDLYASVLFLAAIYAAGVLSARVLRMPALVGEIFAGIALGPSLLNFVPNVEAFVMLGEIGLILLVLEAGIDIDLTTLRLIGARGVVIALVGTFLPVLLAFGLSYLMGYRGVAAISAGCAFAPTSLGIAMNVLKQMSIANTPVGQLIVAAAIIDDMIALVILSQLQAFSGAEVTVVDMAVPIVSALLFLAVGGYLALFVLPPILNKYVLTNVSKATGFSREWTTMFVMFSLLLVLVPASYYGKASPLMGAFLAGLAFCTDSGAHHMFVSQFKRVMQWLLRIFFAASIGFQVPIRKFADTTVILQGLVLVLALLGKIVVGFMAPNFSLSRRFKDLHLRDCLVVGFSMAAEGEFAFVIAAYAVTNAMITQDLYASIVLAVLVSTIIAPFCLRASITYFNKRAGDALITSDAPESLEDGIRRQTAVFYCIQTKSAPAWGIQTNVTQSLCKLNLDVIDHRSYHPRHSTDVLVNEIYARDACDSIALQEKLEVDKQVPNRIIDIAMLLENAIHQEAAIIKVQRWYPEPLMSNTGEDINARVVAATGTALAKSMREENNAYRPMTDGSADHRSMKDGSMDRRPMTDGSSNRRPMMDESMDRRSVADTTKSVGQKAVADDESMDQSIDSRGSFITASLIPVEHIDIQFEGKLNGLIRHDTTPLTMPTDDGVEIMQGSRRRHTLRMKSVDHFYDLN